MNNLSRLIVAPAAVVAAVLLMGAKCESTDSTPKGPLVEAKKECGNLKYVEIGDGGRTLTMDEKGRDEDDGAPRLLMSCIFDQLHTPTRVLEHINRTSAMSGEQTDTWGRYRAGWTYHPSRGLKITITRK